MLNRLMSELTGTLRKAPVFRPQPSRCTSSTALDDLTKARSRRSSSTSTRNWLSKEPSKFTIMMAGRSLRSQSMELITKWEVIRQPWPPQLATSNSSFSSTCSWESCSSCHSAAFRQCLMWSRTSTKVFKTINCTLAARYSLVD